MNYEEVLQSIHPKLHCILVLLQTIKNNQK